MKADLFTGTRMTRIAGWGIAVFFALRIVQDVLHPFFISHDVALVLNCAWLMLRGWMPYVDFVELNPPLIIYLSAPAAAIGDWIGLPHILAFKGLVFLLVLWSVWRVDKGAREEFGDGARVWITLPYAAFMLFVCGVQYGQREHLFVAMFLPYLLRRGKTQRSNSEHPAGSFVLGVVAGIGACIKPYFLLIPLLVEVEIFLRQKNLRVLLKPEVAGFLIAGLAYAAHFFLLPPAMSAALFGRWVPFVASGYVVFGESFTYVLLQPRMLPVYAVLLGVLLIHRLKTSESGLMYRGFVAMLIGGTAAYFLQMKSWVYQMIPSFVASLLTVGSWAAGTPEWRMRVFRSVSGKLLQSTARAALILFLGFSAFEVYHLHLRAERVAAADLLSPIVESYVARGDTVTCIASSVFIAYPMIERMGCYPGSRYLCHFQIPMFYREEYLRGERDVPYHTAAGRSDAETRYFDELREDLSAGNSRVLIIRSADYSQGCPPGFNLKDCLTAAGLADLWNNGYTFVIEVDGNAVYVRNDVLARRSQ